jgi:hypothetical protein
MDSGFRRNDGFWTFDESIKLRFPARNRAGMTQQGFLQFPQRMEIHRIGLTVPGVAIAAFGDSTGIPDIMPVGASVAGAMKKDNRQWNR